MLHHEIFILENMFHHNFDNCVNKSFNNKFTLSCKKQDEKNGNGNCIVLPCEGHASLNFLKLLQPNLRQ